MPSLTFHFSKAARGTAAHFLSTNAVDADIADALRSWAADAAGRSYDVVAHARTYAVATIHFEPTDTGATADLSQRLAVIGIDAEPFRG